MTTHLTNRPFPDDAGDRHVLSAADGQVIATWYEPHPEIASRMADAQRGRKTGGVGKTGRGAALRLAALLMLLSFLTGLWI